MSILVFGSLNIDTVLQVDHFVSAGETLQASETSIFPGGKGLNQAIAIARAGSPVHMAGNIGTDGGFILELMHENGIDSTFVRQLDCLTGAAYIQVDQTGQNCIVLAKNANNRNSIEYVQTVLGNFGAGDILLLQNEINCLPELIDLAAQKDMRTYLNPSPFNKNIEKCHLNAVSGFILNEVEGNQMTGLTEPEQILRAMAQLYPTADIILTLGAKGVLFKNAEMTFQQEAFDVQPVDTTAAGDTFTGYYLACLNAGNDQRTALRIATKAAAIAVTVPGATASIPRMDIVMSTELSECVPDTKTELGRS